jgi:hypothetical protein
MITVSKSYIHWNYFLAIESDLENLSRYIEFIDTNFETYSIELAHLLLASSSESDVVLKELCALLTQKEKRKNIDDYRKIIKSNLPEFINESIYINRYGISVKPWDNWNGDNNPYWWESYNNVKHKRNEYFNQANLRHTISSVGGLLIACYYYYKKLFETESGHILESQKVTEKLQQKSNFMQLGPGFYHDYVYCDRKN